MVVEKVRALPGRGKPAYEEADSLYDEIWDVLDPYKGRMLTMTAIGVLELVKADLIDATKDTDGENG